MKLRLHLLLFILCLYSARFGALASEDYELNAKQKEEAQEIANALIKRDALMADVDRLGKEITDKKKALAGRSTTEIDLTAERAKVEELNKNPTENAAAIDKANEKIKDLTEAQQRLPATSIAEIQMIEEDIKRKNAQITILLGTLTGQFSGEQSFRRNNSITFAVLIGLVIIGFFSLAFIDVNVRIAIFGGESGIQFVALFSIIIAIILFGISGILEGKELSALLGGLSGYILGRTASDRSRSGGNSDGGNPRGGIPNGGIPNGGIPNGGIPNGGIPNGDNPSASAQHAPTSGFTSV